MRRGGASPVPTRLGVGVAALPLQVPGATGGCQCLKEEGDGLVHLTQPHVAQHSLQKGQREGVAVGPPGPQPGRDITWGGGPHTTGTQEQSGGVSAAPPLRFPLSPPPHDSL